MPAQGSAGTARTRAARDRLCGKEGGRRAHHEASVDTVQQLHMLLRRDEREGDAARDACHKHHQCGRLSRHHEEPCACFLGVLGC